MPSRIYISYASETRNLIPSTSDGKIHSKVLKGDLVNSILLELNLSTFCIFFLTLGGAHTAYTKREKHFISFA